MLIGKQKLMSKLSNETENGIFTETTENDFFPPRPRPRPILQFFTDAEAETWDLVSDKLKHCISLSTLMNNIKMRFS
jgi:hypothetical protein